MPLMPSALTQSLTSGCSRLALANTKSFFIALSSATRHMAGYAVCNTRSWNHRQVARTRTHKSNDRERKTTHACHMLPHGSQMQQ
jgi:hypothetical protein